MMDADNSATSHPMDFLLGKELNLPSAGEIRTGWVVEQRDNLILIDIGSKSEGIIDTKEVASMDPVTRARLAVGNEVMVYVVDPEDSNGNLLLSYNQAAEEQDWLLAKKLFETQDIHDSVVVGFNKGGILVELGQIRGFIPNSQLLRERLTHSDQSGKQRYFQKLVGQPIQAKVIEVSRERSRLILSEQAAEKEIRESRRTELLNRVKEGASFEGTIVNIANFGAFVDIGGIEGLVHLSELSWKRVNNPSELFAVGDKVNVYILNIDEERQRIALSIKRLEADPWTMIDKFYHVGQLVTATITRLTKFGAFARLNDDYELEGLIHISELSEDRVEHPREVVKASDQVTVRVIRVDPEQRQLGLSLRQVASEKYLEKDLQMMSSL